MECYAAVSAGVYVEGPVVVLSFLTDGVIDDGAATVLLTPELLACLQEDIAAALGQSAGQAQEDAADTGEPRRLHLVDSGQAAASQAKTGASALSP